jgi:hypothetical protein
LRQSLARTDLAVMIGAINPVTTAPEGLSKATADKGHAVLDHRGHAAGTLIGLLTSHNE